MSGDWIELSTYISAEEHERIFGNKESFDSPVQVDQSLNAKSFEDPDVLFDKNFDSIDWSKK